MRVATPTSEQYGVFRAYLDARHPDGGMADMTLLDYAMMIEDSCPSRTAAFIRLYDSGEPDLLPSPGGRRQHLGDDGQDQREPDADARARENVGNRVWQPDLEQRGEGARLIVLIAGTSTAISSELRPSRRLDQ